MRQEIVTDARVVVPPSAWWRDAAALGMVWIRALPRLGGVLYFSAGVLMLLLVKSLVRTFGHAS